VVELEEMLKEHYKVHGWNVETGLPTVNKLSGLKLHDVVEELRKSDVKLK